MTFQSVVGIYVLSSFNSKKCNENMRNIVMVCKDSYEFVGHGDVQTDP